MVDSFILWQIVLLYKISNNVYIKTSKNDQLYGRNIIFLTHTYSNGYIKTLKKINQLCGQYRIFDPDTHACVHTDIHTHTHTHTHMPVHSHTHVCTHCSLYADFALRTRLTVSAPLENKEDEDWPALCHLPTLNGGCLPQV